MPEQLELELHPPSGELKQLWTPDDIYRAAGAETINTFKEDRRVERKPCGIAPRAIGDYLSMYANTQPHGGVVFIGVENDGTISGCKKLSTEQLNKFEEVRNYCPDARHEFKRVEVINKDGERDFVVALRIYYRDDKLVETTAGDAYVRVGESKKLLLEAEKREIRINKGEVEYELEPVTLKWPDEFAESLVNAFAASYITKRNLKGTHSREGILELVHLGKRVGGEFRPNLACALVFAKNPRAVVPGARLRIARYEGTSEQFGKKLNQVYDTYIDGPLPLQIQQAEEIIVGQIKNFTRLGTDGRFYTRPEYPRDVWREALINACVHRSYNLRYMNIFIKMFDDKFVVESPGGFLPPTTPETIYEAHNPRNPYIMEALFYLDFVRCAYEGTRRMRDEMIEANLPPPEFFQSQIGTHQVHVTLKNNAEHRKTYLNPAVVDLVGSDLFKELNEGEKLVINVASEKGKVSVSETARLIGKDWHAGKTVLEGLVKKGVFVLRQRSGKDRESSKRYVLRQQVVRDGSQGK